MKQRGRKEAPSPGSEQGRLIMGRNSLEEALVHAPQNIIEVYVCKHQRLDQRGNNLISLVRKAGVSVRMVEEGWLTELVGAASHQSFAALMRGERTVELASIIAKCSERAHACVLLLDAVTDPHNLGAILRASECFGVDGVVWSKNRGASLGATVSKVSVGASEIVPISLVANLVDAARKLKEAGFWLVGAEVRDGATDLDSFEFPTKCALVLGSEGSGLQALLSKELDFRVFIRMHGQIDSLNVSQATAVLLHAWRRGVAGEGEEH